MAWHAAIMSTSPAQRAQAARVTKSASLNSPLVRGVAAGSVQRVTAAHSLSVIVGAGERGAVVQAHNVIRQASSGPRADSFVFIDESPEVRLIRGERRVDRAACAVELRTLLVFLARVGDQAVDYCVARAEVLARLAGGVLGDGEPPLQRADILDARQRGDERAERQPVSKRRAVHAAAFAPA
ncbi:hypothetical protein WM16_13785 [Burkholderia ubonensis]|uniref:Uncharacterized protein n=1 Tax=Burkholderia ubonensis TaxID=101571 RepID=A0A102XW75_9BURK|nr:hypothetical protein WI76_09125 [Burkholderia ubonensis]KWK75344.1 hypothetical protein WM16_13785 [Burkholderia ubonensis]